MFKGLGNLGNLAGLMKSAQEMGGKMQAVNDQLKGQRVTGASGGGMVEVEANGLGEILRVKIEPALIEKGEGEMIEDLVPAAVNEAVAKANQLRAGSMEALTEGLNIPGLGDAITRITGSDIPTED